MAVSGLPGALRTFTNWLSSKRSECDNFQLWMINSIDSYLENRYRIQPSILSVTWDPISDVFVCCWYIDRQRSSTFGCAGFPSSWFLNWSAIPSRMRLHCSAAPLDWEEAGWCQIPVYSTIISPMYCMKSSDLTFCLALSPMLGIPWM